MTDPRSVRRDQDPAVVIAGLRAAAASLRSEAARIGGASASTATASDRLCRLTVSGRGEIIDVTFTQDIARVGSAALERSVETVYAEASRTVATAAGGSRAGGSRAGGDAAPGPDVSEAARRLAAIDQWGASGVVAAAPTPDPEVLRDPARFNDILAGRIDRLFAAFERVGPQLRAIVGQAASPLCEVRTGPDGVPTSVRFTARAPAAGPEALAQDLRDTLAAAAADALRQRDTLLDDTSGGGRG